MINQNQIDKMQKIAIFLLLGLLSMACKQSAKTDAQIEKVVKEELVAATIEELVAAPMEYKDKEVVLQGMVSHVCRHGGQKCFVVGSDGETQIRLVPGGDIDEFKVDLEGSTLAVKGFFRVMAAEVAEANVEDHESKEHHAVEQSHSEAEKADIFVEVLEVKEVTP